MNTPDFEHMVEREAWITHILRFYDSCTRRWLTPREYYLVARIFRRLDIDWIFEPLGGELWQWDRDLLMYRQRRLEPMTIRPQDEFASKTVLPKYIGRDHRDPETVLKYLRNEPWRACLYMRMGTDNIAICSNPIYLRGKFWLDMELIDAQTHGWQSEA